MLCLIHSAFKVSKSMALHRFGLLTVPVCLMPVLLVDEPYTSFTASCPLPSSPQLPGAETHSVHQRTSFKLHLHQVRSHGEVLRHGQC